MSLHLSVISIEGDHLGQIEEIFERFNYRIPEPPTVVTKYDDLEKHFREVSINRTKVKKVVWSDGEWTYIMDFELVMIDDVTAWQEFSSDWHARILCWICEGASGTYAFSLYDNGNKMRSLFYCDGKLSDNSGNPLREEEGLDMKQPFEDDILTITERLGASYNDLEKAGKYLVYLLDESHMEIHGQH